MKRLAAGGINVSSQEPERPCAPWKEPEPPPQEAVPPRHPVALPEPPPQEAEPPRNPLR
jgi:hypothetical protein